MEQTIQTSLEPTVKKKLNKANIIMAALLLLALAAAITFGVLFAAEKQHNNSQDQTATDCITNATIDTSVIEHNENATKENPEDYLYIAQWGIKIKLPENLKNLYYSFSAEGKDRFTYSDGDIRISDHPAQLTVGGTDGDGEGVTPSFATQPLGTVTRYKAGTYACEASCPTYVMTINGYDYYYAHPQAVTSADDSDVEWEIASVKLIEQMLSTQENYASF